MAGLAALAQVMWINILLSGDNAIAIGLACRGLSPPLRKKGIFYGSAVAILMRIAFALIVAWLMQIAWLKIVGGVLLLWIAVTLALGEDDDHDVHAHEHLWRAVVTIVVADATMSLDNVLGIAAVARGNVPLFVTGLVLSMPLIIVGATAVTRVLDRFPVIVWAGAALLGWVAGGLIIEDSAIKPWLEAWFPNTTESMLHYACSGLCAALVLAIAWPLKRRRQYTSRR
jgi:YjbE family integral membrane protein